MDRQVTVSLEAINWVLNDAPDVPPQLVSTLIGLASHAASDGRAAYPSQATLARYARKDARSVRRDLAKLEELGLIRRGDQRIAEHLQKDRRPVVYDLVISDMNGAFGGTSTSGGTSASGGTSTSERADVGVRNGGTSTSAEPSLKPSRTVPTAGRPAPPTSPRKSKPRKQRTKEEQIRFETADQIAHQWWDEECPQRGIPVMAEGNRGPKNSFPGFRGFIEKALAAGITDTEIKHALVECGAAWPTRTALERAVTNRRGRNPNPSRRPTNQHTEPAAADSLAEVFE